MQLESYEKEGNNDSTTAQDVTKRKMSKKLDMKCKELTNMQQYVCHQRATTEPPVRE